MAAVRPALPTCEPGPCSNIAEWRAYARDAYVYALLVSDQMPTASAAKAWVRNTENDTTAHMFSPKDAPSRERTAILLTQLLNQPVAPCMIASALPVESVANIMLIFSQLKMVTKCPQLSDELKDLLVPAGVDGSVGPSCHVGSDG